jgi:RNA polymerase I-specific transcription initiation factor RRN6
MLHSRVNNLIQIHSFSEATSDSSSLITCSDPTLLDLSIGGSGHITNIYIERMQWEDSRKDVNYLQLFVMLSDWSVHELVVYTRISTTDNSTENDHAVADFTRNQIKRPRTYTSRSKAVDKDGDFVTPDGLVAAQSPSPKITMRRPGRNQAMDGAGVRDVRDNTFLGNILSLSKSAADISSAIDVVTVMDQVNEMLATGADLPPLPLGTL